MFDTLSKSRNSKPPVALYWWHAQPNFGDQINRRIVEHVSGRRVRRSSIASADLLAIGSVLGFPEAITRLHAPQDQQPLIWGSGMLKDPGTLLDEVRVGSRCLAVRGPLTAAKLKGFDGVLGDAGLLCPQIQPMKGTRRGVAYVPHHAQWQNPRKLDCLRENGVRLIDVRQDDPWDVVDQISGCEMVISSSLHGLVVSDAYGVPNIWVAASDWMARKGAFKFFDYFGAVGRNVAGPVSMDEALRLSARGAVGFDHTEKIEAVCKELASVLPAALDAS